MKRYLAMTTALMLAASSLLGAAPSFAQSKGEIVIGLQCDRTGATQIVGTVLCPGFHDYVALVNSKGGVEGRMLKVLEIDHEYKVPPGVEAYERHKKDGAVSMAIYGTPHIYALAAKLTEDRIPGTSRGFGSAAAADGQRYPYIFPIAATYWSQGAPAASASPRATTPCSSPASARTIRCSTRSARCTKSRASRRPKRWTRRCSTTVAC